MYLAGEVSVSLSLNLSCRDPRPAGGWLKMERSFFLRKRRADFVAGALSGRVIVAGGLGKDEASRLSADTVPEQEKAPAACALPAYRVLPNHSKTPLPGWASQTHGGGFLVKGKREAAVARNFW